MSSVPSFPSLVPELDGLRRDELRRLRDDRGVDTRVHVVEEIVEPRLRWRNNDLGRNARTRRGRENDGDRDAGSEAGLAN